MHLLFCVRCKCKKECDKVEKITTKNCRTALTAPCPTCNCKMFKFCKADCAC